MSPPSELGPVQPAPGAHSVSSMVSSASALAGGKTRGAASELHLPGGKTIVDVSGSARVLIPDMVDALESVPEEIRPDWHQWCSEIGCMNTALNDGEALEGGTMRTVAIGDSSPGHLMIKPACPTCSWVMGHTESPKVAENLILSYSEAAGDAAAKWREFMLAVGSLLASRRDELPSALQLRLDEVNSQWASALSATDS